MRRLLFTELLLLSVSTKRARHLRFHPKATLIVGDNESGKSVLIRSIYETLGASSKTEPDVGWASADIRTLLRFTVDGANYAAMKERDVFTLFSSDFTVIGVYRQKDGQLRSRLSELFDFRLSFAAGVGGTRVAHQAYLFSPFYVDQVRGWSRAWSSLSAFRLSRRKDALEYHMGIRPNAYYVAKATAEELKAKLREPSVRIAALRRVLEDLEKTLGQADFQIDEVAYKEEIQAILLSCGNLRAKEESFRDSLVNLSNERISLATQIGIVAASMRELHRDYEYAIRTDPEVECPMCGAEYENSIVNTFGIAQDEDRCVQMLTELSDALKTIDEQIQAEQAKYEQSSAELDELNRRLAYKQGELSLRDVIRSEGKREIKAVISADVGTLSQEIDAAEAEIRQSRRIMRELNEPRRRASIVDRYYSRLRQVAEKLGVSPIPIGMTTSIVPEITGGGSDLPRRLLAYYVAILFSVREAESSSYCPLVVDSVNQQDQAPENLTRMLGLLSTGLPEDTQLILACVDTRGIDFGGDVIKLDGKYGALRGEDYEAVVQEFRFAINARFKFENGGEGDLDVEQDEHT